MYVSPAYERIWGRTCESLYQNPASFFDAVHVEDRQRLLDMTAQLSGQPSITNFGSSGLMETFGGSGIADIPCSIPERASSSTLGRRRT